MPKTGDVVADKYRIEQLIGVGGMGAVFSAIHQFTGKRVALKWMLPELAKDADAVARFMREAHAAGRISHPNVVDVYDVGQHAGSYFLVMEFLQGEPLTSALARRDLTPAEVLTLLLPAMRGVAAAHRQGVVHRDLKPDNIFLAYEEDGVRREAKVLDFGISKIAEDATNMRLTRTGAVVGTPYYMSPEQIRGSHSLDRRADVYAFGVILYEALTGQVPFHADTYGALVLEIATGTPKSPDELVPSLTPELSRVVLRAMARDLNARYPTMESLIGALEPHATSAPPRMDLRSRSQYGQDLETTQALTPSSELLQHYAAAPHLPMRPPTKPHLASTPFAAELPQEGVLQRKTLLGATAFVGSAAVMVTAIWWFTREPEVGNTLAPARQPVQDVQVGDLPRTQGVGNGTRPEEVPTLSQGAEGVPTGMQAPETPPAGDPAQQPTAPNIFDPYASGTVHPSDANMLKPLGHAGKARGGRKRGARGGDENEARGESRARSEPAQSEGTDPGPAHRARSGSLNVNEF
jgi:serine/threonine-protein kinase